MIDVINGFDENVQLLGAAMIACLLCLIVALLFQFRAKARLSLGLVEAQAALRAATSDVKRLFQERQELGATLNAERQARAKAEQDLASTRAAYGAIRNQFEELNEAYAAEQESTRELQEHIGRITADLRQARTEREQQAIASKRELQQAKSTQEEMVKAFEALSLKALDKQSEAVAQRSRETVEKSLEPLKVHVSLFQRELKQMHEGGMKDRTELRKEIEGLSKRSERLSQDAEALTKALKSDNKTQGSWGEMVLEGLLERSGLRKGEEYEVQAHRVSEEGGRLRPDVVVKMPGGKTMVVDSKVSLTAFTKMVNTEDDTVLAQARKDHVASLKAHVNGLAKKDYAASEDLSVDYVILFVPIEGALSEALAYDPALTEFAVEQNVMIATPTTLMMALKTVANVWSVERRNQNAEEIARQAGGIYDKVVGFVETLDAVGQRLGQAQTSYEKAVGQLSQGSGNLLGRVQKLQKLGAKTSKSMPDHVIQEEENLIETR